jgi:uncharacterized protein (TIGR00251 family)
MLSCIKQTENGVLLTVRVKAGSGNFSIFAKEDFLEIRTRNQAEDNKANQEIVKSLMKILRRDVRIIRGLKSRHKEIFVAGASPQEVEILLARK